MKIILFIIIFAILIGSITMIISKKKIPSFNSWFDFIERIIKLIIFILVIILIIGKLRYIDWEKSGNNLIEAWTPIKISTLSKAITSTTIEVHELFPQIDYSNIYQNDKIVFTIDKPYDTNKKEFTIEKMVIKGKPDYKQIFLYAGAKIKIVRIKESIGMLITGQGVEGPVLRGVDCVVIK